MGIFGALHVASTSTLTLMYKNVCKKTNGRSLNQISPNTSLHFIESCLDHKRLNCCPCLRTITVGNKLELYYVHVL